MRYTIGLICNGHGLVNRLVAVCIKRSEDGRTRHLQAESAHTMKRMAGAQLVSEDEWQNLELDPYDNVKLARWALNKCGWTISAEDQVGDD